MIYIIESQLNPLRRQILALVRPDLLERELQNEKEVMQLDAIEKRRVEGDILGSR